MDTMVAAARESAGLLAAADTRHKNAALREMARLLERYRKDIIRANRKDLETAAQKGIAGPILKRMEFGEQKIAGRVKCLHKIAVLPDPVGQVYDTRKLENGLLAGRMRVPLGVILMIYEARAHVTVNAGAFALKSGNAIICKGGSEIANTNNLLGDLWRKALGKNSLPPAAVQVVALTHRQVNQLLQQPQDINLVIPRGGRELVAAVVKNSLIPVIKHFEGICHLYVGRNADRRMALRIILDSKLLMPAVCNAAETVLLDASLEDWIPELAGALVEQGITVRGCARFRKRYPEAEPADETDWSTEYLDLVYSVKVVDGLDEAVDHITRYGSGHTDAIITGDYLSARRFVQQVDSGVVLVNASTMFCDGETLGMGAEIGISTDKIHARGPMGLEELTSYKHVLWGDGQVMGTEI